ncbi:MAG: HAMP domain-containing histidine kinase [Proteobacteria bacterium]|nr:MAG: HAMP domain-containing histidine kinase [Pseudomonadota bacterium]
MNRAEALRNLSAESSHTRYKAAAILGDVGLPADLPELMRAKSLEFDAYVIRRLEKTVELINKASVGQSELILPLSTDEVTSESQTRAVEWITGVLLHEIGSKLGLVALAASREVEDYEKSKTKRHIRNFQGIFSAIEQLRSATVSPRPEQFDLAELIEEVAQVEKDSRDVELAFHGMRPEIVFSDRNLVRLALCNGIRNAIEASISSKSKTEHTSSTKSKVIIAWGVTDIDYWISIIDNGPGLASSSSALFQIGKTTKHGHPGFGLPIARQAIETLDGIVSLSNSVTGGANYLIRWNKNERIAN